jgi:pilus assembly protein TadC
MIAATEPLVGLALVAAVLASGTRHGSLRLQGMFSGSATATGAARRARRATASLGAGLLVWALTGTASAAVLVTVIGLGIPTALRRLAGLPARRTDDAVEVAAAWVELAVCLEAGLPVAVAVAAAAEPLRGPTGSVLRRVAGLLELGADPAEAWRAAVDDPAAAPFARAAARSAATGAALARTARAESARVRAALSDTAEARAQRAGVLIAAPLGLCFLPAFLLLGIAPVVIGLAGEVLPQW